MEKRTFRNKAFLSYRHVKRDGKLAALLQEKLDTGAPDLDPGTNEYRSKPHVYNTKGSKLGTIDIWPQLPQGIYIVEGKVRMK